MKSPGRDWCLVPRPGTQSGCRAGSAHPSAVRRWASGLASLSLGFLLGRTGVPLQAGRRLGPRAGSVLGAMALTFWLHSGAILRCPQRRTEAHTTPSCTGPPPPSGRRARREQVLGYWIISFANNKCQQQEALSEPHHGMQLSPLSASALY